MIYSDTGLIETLMYRTRYKAQSSQENIPSVNGTLPSEKVTVP